MAVRELFIKRATPAIAVAVLILAPFASTLAQQAVPGSGQALEISPTIVTMDVDPGESTTMNLQLRNVSGEELVVSGDINDFVASDEGGAPRVIMDEEDAADNPYSLRDWVEPLPETLLEPGNIETLTANITVPENASPGGHYGIIRYSGSPPELEGTGVSLAASVGTLVLLTVSGDIETSVELEEFFIAKDGEAGNFFESTPLTLVQRIRNSGNVHVQTTGQVTIRDMFDRELASANVNLARNNILPDSIRRFEQNVDSSLIGNKRLFGRYSAELNLVYGDEQTLTDTITFWVIPYRLIGLIILLLALGYLGLHYSLKRYRKRILSQARRRY